ncbi:hypothetical protein ACSAZL_07250 [Methanosarcina sp. T3]|uniref:hypothetical protein n=1 Tax=Methanosarcina sp. T3 TaxID=3439062 RepID=UPI003F87F3CC
MLPGAFVRSAILNPRTAKISFAGKTSMSTTDRMFITASQIRKCQYGSMVSSSNTTSSPLIETPA